MTLQKNIPLTGPYRIKAAIIQLSIKPVTKGLVIFYCAHNLLN